jgi:hypothetical protein
VFDRQGRAFLWRTTRAAAGSRRSKTYNLTLVTHNTREFSRIQGLSIEDWEASAT